jgi:hypothetical protein
MSSLHLAQLTLEAWRASGARTEQRRETLLNFYAGTYYGSPDRWNEDVRSMVESARLLMRQRTRIDEIQYA